MNDIVTFLTGHNYLALALFLIIYLRKLAGPSSSFPVTVPPQWLPVVTGVLAMAYGAVTDAVATKPFMTIVIDALSIGGSVGVADALLTAIFASGNAPKWAKAIVFIFDDLTGAGGQNPPSPPAPPAPPNDGGKADVSKPMPKIVARAAGFATALLVITLTCTSCLKNGQIVPPPDPIPQDLQAVAACVMPLLAQGADFPTLVAQCAPQDAALIVAVLGLLQKSNQLAADDPATSVQASICYQQAHKEGLVKP